MKDMIFAFIHQYAVWGILIAVVLALIVLHCTYRQMKKLNRNLGMVTAKVQQYFDIIMKDEDEEEEIERRAAYEEEAGARRRAVHSEEERERRSWPREEDFQLTRGEREMLLSDRGERTSRNDRKRNKNQEEVLDAVLQEYFS